MVVFTVNPILEKNTVSCIRAKDGGRLFDAFEAPNNAVLSVDDITSPPTTQMSPSPLFFWNHVVTEPLRFFFFLKVAKKSEV